ncbi:MAG TPA: hypothetical protein PKY82_01195 [Pyrinomonadaceae bacterium]|nr:hypothetical protein [Pyrinomonadaceae bacterium]
MKSAIYGIALMLVFLFGVLHHSGKSYAKQAHETDKISGDWDGTVEAVGTKVAFKLSFKLEGEKLTGTVESGHTGAGTINGTLKNGKLNFTATFAKHESISFKGELRGDKITGEYATEGRVEKWGAVKQAKSGSSASSINANSSNDISGDWDAFLVAQDANAPVALKLKLEGGKLTGTYSSEHLGTGSLEDTTWEGGKIGFTMKTPQATIKTWGVFKDGKLAGDFDAGIMKGKWEAKRK